MDKNVFEKRADELKKYKREDESIFPEDQEEIKARSTRKAPYIPIFWIERFLDLNRRQIINFVDAEFARLNISVGAGNESRMISALRFLGLIDGSGRATPKLASLRVSGDHFKQNLQKVVREAYTDLVSTIVIEAVRPEILISFFSQRYGYSYSIARQAARLFIGLCLQAGMPISEALRGLVTELSQPTRSKSSFGQRTLPESASRATVDVVLPSQETSIQATVNIQLDKDTPKELWDRVLALLGEKRKQENP